MRIRPLDRRPTRTAGLLVLAVTLAGAACSGTDDAATDAAEPPGAVTERSVSADAGAAGGFDADALGSSASAADGSAGAARVPAPAEAVPVAAPAPLRLRAVTGELVVRADRGDELADVQRSATVAVTGLGGFVFAQEASFGDGGPDDGGVRLTFKVPPDRFDDAVERLSELGTPLRSTVDTTDVTDQVVDLDARITSAEASVTRVRALLAEADDLGEVTSLEGELTRRETLLEQLVGQRRQTVGAVELSTLTFTLEPAMAAATAPTDDDGWLASVPGFGSALSGGWRAFTGALRVLGAGVGYAGPFLVVGGAAVAMLRLVERRRGAGRRLAAAGPASGRDGEI